MNPEAYHDAAEIFAQACDLAPEQRAAFLDQACGSRDALRRQVEAMLAADAQPGLEPGGAIPDGLSGVLDRKRSLPDLPPAPAGWQIPGYELLEPIGRGGMGVVYKARQLQPNRIVAIKMIRDGQLASVADIQRFYAEANAAANVDDDGIVPVYEVGEYHGEPYFTMRFVDGVNLADRLKSGELTLDEGLRMVLAVSQAVASVHAQGIVHRDLKPSNILIDRDGRPRVTDFGLAKCLHGDSSLTAAGDIMGTPGYMSPEQASGTSKTVTAATDVYSLGAILYELLAGQPPIQAAGHSAADTLRRIREHEVTPVRRRNRRVPKDLNTICMKCLETDPNKRYPTAAELAADLRRYLEGEPICARPLSLRRRVLRWARRNPGLAATWAGVSVFYAYHLVCCYVLRFPEITLPFHLVATLVVGTWAAGAWFFQRMMNHTGGDAAYLFGWATLDVVLLTLLLFASGGVNSSLVNLYFVLVAGSVLRGRARLVGYMTALSLGGYLLHVADSYAHASGPPFLTVFPFVISLLVIGVIQYLALRQVRTRKTSSS